MTLISVTYCTQFLSRYSKSSSINQHNLLDSDIFNDWSRATNISFIYFVYFPQILAVLSLYYCHFAEIPPHSHTFWRWVVHDHMLFSTTTLCDIWISVWRKISNNSERVIICKCANMEGLWGILIFIGERTLMNWNYLRHSSI